MIFDPKDYKTFIFNNLTRENFEEFSLKVFKYQYNNNNVYNSYCNYLKINPDSIKSVTKIPFLPVELFKSQKIITGNLSVQAIFMSSNTTGCIPSKHYVTDVDIYKKSFLNGFKKIYGNPNEYCILGLLPSYLDREGSSLIYMVNELVALSDNPLSGFFLNDFKSLFDIISRLESEKSKYLLIGVSFGLLDFCEQYALNIKNGIIMETGGMKGRRKELVRDDLHSILREGFGVSDIHSEYGMTELLSQAYSLGKGIFNCPPWMRVYAREIDDPLSVKTCGTGGINIVDLANINSCGFIAVSDLGEVYPDLSFSISGRIDNSDVRGCNLMTL
jgi:hypothetical protein